MHAHGFSCLEGVTDFRSRSGRIFSGFSASLRPVRRKTSARALGVCACDGSSRGHQSASVGIPARMNHGCLCNGLDTAFERREERWRNSNETWRREIRRTAMQ
eukprot:scaffold394_cov237-Pinguiococcus_pyrenoidosus.AAC.7